MNLPTSEDGKRLVAYIDYKFEELKKDLVKELKEPKKTTKK